LDKIPVKTFPIKKRINTELFIDGEVMLIYKNKGGIGSRNPDKMKAFGIIFALFAISMVT